MGLGHARAGPGDQLAANKEEVRRRPISGLDDGEITFDKEITFHREVDFSPGQAADSLNLTAPTFFGQR